MSWRIYNQVDVVPYFPVDIADNYQPVTTGYAINSLGKVAPPEALAFPVRPVIPGQAGNQYGWLHPSPSRSFILASILPSKTP